MGLALRRVESVSNVKKVRIRWWSSDLQGKTFGMYTTHSIYIVTKGS